MIRSDIKQKFYDGLGNIHRDNHPAIIYHDGRKEWFFHGKKYAEIISGQRIIVDENIYKQAKNFQQTTSSLNDKAQKAFIRKENLDEIKLYQKKIVESSKRTKNGLKQTLRTKKKIKDFTKTFNISSQQFEEMYQMYSLFDQFIELSMQANQKVNELKDNFKQYADIYSEKRYFKLKGSVISTEQGEIIVDDKLFEKVGWEGISLNYYEIDENIVRNFKEIVEQHQKFCQNIWQDVEWFYQLPRFCSTGKDLNASEVRQTFMQNPEIFEEYASYFQTNCYQQNCLVFNDGKPEIYFLDDNNKINHSAVQRFEAMQSFLDIDIIKRWIVDSEHKIALVENLKQQIEEETVMMKQFFEKQEEEIREQFIRLVNALSQNEEEQMIEKWSMNII